MKTQARLTTVELPSNIQIAQQFSGFPRAKGFLRDIMDAHEAGELSDDELVDWLIEATTKKPVVEAHTATKGRYATTRQPHKLDDRCRTFFMWMARLRNVRPDTAQQYARRIERMLGQIDREGAEVVLGKYVREGGNNQVVAALKLWCEYEGEH